MATPAEISALYNQYLGRDPLQGGIDAWLATGQSIEQIEQGIANSPEAAVYETFNETIGRDPTMEERDYFVNVNPAPIEAVKEVLSGTQEAQEFQTQKQLDETDMLADTTADDTTADTTVDTTAEITEDDEKIAIALNLVANSPDTMGLGVAAALNENRPDPVMKGEDGQLHETNAVLDANGNWIVNPSDEEAVYYFTQPLEDDRYNNYGQPSDDYSRSYGQGNYYTKDEIKEFWDGDKGTGMELFKEQNPNLTFDDYFSFVEESNQLYVDNPNATYADNQQNVDSIADKYGITTTYTDKDGQVWGFNGSGLSQTKFVDTSLDVGNLIMGAAATALTAGALGPTVSGYLGGGALGKAGAAGISNVAGQLASTGSVDPAAALASAVTAGINPGGMLSDKLGLVPDNVVSGFVQGATNELVSSGITEGKLDVEGAVVSGLIGAGVNAASDLLSDASNNSIEAEMERIKQDRAVQGLPELTADQLYAAALTNAQVGVSDLGGLVGEGGLLPFIEPVSTKGINNLLGGGAFSPVDVFIGPDGKKYTDVEVLAGAAGEGVSPADIYYGEVPGWTSGVITQQNTILGNSLDFAKENIPGVDQAAGVVSGLLDAAAAVEFKNTYGATAEEFLESGTSMEEIQRMIAYGPLDEIYNFAVNPRGTSQMVGTLSGIPGLYSTGANNPFRSYVDPTNTITGTGYIPDAINVSTIQDDAATATATANAAAGNVAIINLSGTETAISASTVLPGTNTTLADAILGGFIDGVLIDTQNNNSTVSSGGETVTQTLDVEIADTISNVNTLDTSVNNNTTLDTFNVNTVETVVPETPVLPPSTVETVVPETPVLPPSTVETTVPQPTVLPPSTVETVVPQPTVLPSSTNNGGGGGGMFGGGGRVGGGTGTSQDFLRGLSYTPTVPLAIQRQAPVDFAFGLMKPANSMDILGQLIFRNLA